MTAPPAGAQVTTRVRVPILGMTCAACETRVSKALGGVPGVHPVSVSARSGTATLDVHGAVPWEGVVTAPEAPRTSSALTTVSLKNWTTIR